MTADGRCGSTHCVTCSDEGVPMEIVGPAVDGLALCRSSHGEPVTVMTDLVGAVRPGDVVLVHAGVALTVTERPEDVR